MKKIIIGIMVVATVFTSCSKKVKNVSTVSTVPTMTLVGNLAYTVPVGGPYTDPGASFTDEDGTTKVIQPTTSNLDLTKPGFYTLRYEKHTVSGYNAAAIRTVLVTSVSASLDYSGVYVRASNGQPMNVRKVGTGLFVTDNVGGVAGNANFIFDTYMGFPDANTLVIPPQATALGELTCTNVTFSATSADTTFSYVVINSNYGGAVRVFSHQ